MARHEAVPLQALLQRGGELEAEYVGQPALAEAASQAGLAVCVADCSRARNRSAVLRAISKAVDFPLYFGANLDALFDCLSDTVQDQKVGVVLVLEKLHSADPGLADEAAAIASVLTDVVAAAEESGRVFCYVIEHVGAHEDA